LTEPQESRSRLGSVTKATQEMLESCGVPVMVEVRGLMTPALVVATKAARQTARIL
jgi:hypothetical protein